MNFKTLLASLVLSLALALPAFAAEQVDINSADAKTLAEGLNGVGMSKAEAIVAYRDEHGPFASAEDLSQVKGIGEKTVEKNRDNIVVGHLMNLSVSLDHRVVDGAKGAAFLTDVKPQGGQGGTGGQHCGLMRKSPRRRDLPDRAVCV